MSSVDLLDPIVAIETEESSLFPFQDAAPIKREFVTVAGQLIPRYEGEFWTSRQRQGCSLHEISYRACFKPQLPRLFIRRLTAAGDRVYDPFSGRGTTVLEAGLLNRLIIANDINPLSEILTRPRFFPPDWVELEARLAKIPMNPRARADLDLSMFYHPRTEAELVSLQQYLAERRACGKEDEIDAWIRMVATNRLSGHSPGFFSVYSLPPNQAVSPERQVQINKKRNQVPEYRDTRRLILKKSRSLLRHITPRLARQLKDIGRNAQFLACDARHTHQIAGHSVDLVVTSPPFLNVVQYEKDNWLRLWFNQIDGREVQKRITVTASLEKWQAVMREVFSELFRIVKPGGWIAFEVGEVKKGSLPLEQVVAPLGLAVGLQCVAIFINVQSFTKTANIWGIDNNRKGTNSNRIVLMRRP